MKIGWLIGNSVKAMGVAFVVCAHSAMAGLIFQADFNGTGNGTGGLSDLVTYGGTGVLNATLSGKGTASISSSSTLGGGNYISSVMTSSGAAPKMVTFTPTVSNNSWAAMSSVPDSTTSSPKSFSLNGAFDCFVRLNSNTGTSQSWFRPVDFDNRSNNGLRITFTGVNVDQLQFQLSSPTGTLALSTNGTAFSSAVTLSTIYAMAAGTEYHLGFTMSTNSSTGQVTVKIYGTTGQGEIDTTSATNLLGSTTFYTSTYGTGSTSGTELETGFTSAAWSLYSTYDTAAIASSDYDLVRMYDSAVTSFSAIPEPSTYLMAILGLFMIACFYRKLRVCA